MSETLHDVVTMHLMIDVTDVSRLASPAFTAVTVTAPVIDGASESNERPVVCFAFPGGGYSRGYFAIDSAETPGGQAAWHAARGWWFVSCDHLGVGESTIPDEELTRYESVADANAFTVRAVLDLLAAGDASIGGASIVDPVVLGIGQSMGGCFSIVMQAHHQVFDGLAVLGFSAMQTVVRARPGKPQPVRPWLVRGSDPPIVLNQPAVTRALEEIAAAPAPPTAVEAPMAWTFHWQDPPPELVARDLEAALGRSSELPHWRSKSGPASGRAMTTPGTIASEAASITVPILLATGERDVVPDPWLEPIAYRSASDITVFVCPRMAHMHNFADTRELLWQRLRSWGEGVVAALASR
jgi:pimeloyl-ACP methyl ester carboxylesterase